jgi:hypothetical protein
MKTLLSNAANWKTSLVGLLFLLAALPQADWVQHAIALSPVMAMKVTGIGLAAAGVIKIFGFTDPGK